MLSTPLSREDLRYQVHHGAFTEEQIEALLPLRLKLFLEYPYLYVGDPTRERRNWSSMPTQSLTSVFAYAGAQLVGALIAYEEDVAKHRALAQYPLYRPAQGLHIDLIMVVEEYRTYGTAREMQKRLEQDARARGYTDLYGITIVRSANHPLKPERALDVYPLFSRAGFRALALYEVWNWPTRCGTPGNEFIAPIDNTIQYWHKVL